MNTDVDTSNSNNTNRAIILTLRPPQNAMISWHEYPYRMDRF